LINVNDIELNLIIVSENLSFPIDEGIKKYSYYFAEYCKNHIHNVRIFSQKYSDNYLCIEPLPDNKLLFSLRFYKAVNSFGPQIIVYIPNSSSTIYSFLRLKLINLYSRKAKTVLFSLQKRRYNLLEGFFIRILMPSLIVSLSTSESKRYRGLGLESTEHPIGVDLNKFIPVSEERKNELRKRYGLSLENKYALHIGHLNRSRNLKILKKLQEFGYRILIVGSTSTKIDVSLKNELENDNYFIINSYIERVEEIYQLSDLYVFTVVDERSAIEFPLTILEAMSCNLPVLTTKFGGTADFVPENDSFKYFDDETEMIEKLSKLKTKEVKNRDFIKNKFSWSIVFDGLIKKIMNNS
jgi:glycosyltransferase involved in cell wall biosynthesis